MKAATKPFASKYDSGRCPVCKRRISKGAVIVRLEETASWTVEERSRSGKAYLRVCYAEYAHEKCLGKGEVDE